MARIAKAPGRLTAGYGASIARCVVLAEGLQVHQEVVEENGGVFCHENNSNASSVKEEPVSQSRQVFIYRCAQRASSYLRQCATRRSGQSHHRKDTILNQGFHPSLSQLLVDVAHEVQTCES